MTAHLGRVASPVERLTVFQAECRCGWHGPERRSYAEALADLDVHEAQGEQP